MTSRLDRLFVLLEAGTGAATRRAAARQLGEVQKAHPEELHRLLGRLMRYLRSPTWETRVAAAQAVEAILKNVPEWVPVPFDGKKEVEDPEATNRLTCETFDIDKIMKKSAQLMSCEGNEYDMEVENLSAAELKDLIAKQKQQLNSKMGFDMAASFGVDLNSVYTTEDLCPQYIVNKEPVKRPVQEVLMSPSKSLSSREMNLAKRKARQLAFGKQKSCEDGPSTPTTPEPDKKKIKVEPLDEYYVDSSNESWPLSGWANQVSVGLVASQWETRHGSAMALRALLRSKICRAAGKLHGMTKDRMEDAHQEWLEDMALRLLCVLALDRFGDFVSDQVVAPVRETCAQTLGVALSSMRGERVRSVADLLIRLASYPQWEARHGALLGLKYLLAARQEEACSIGCLNQLVQSLEDSAEDVSAVAAGALLPAVSTLAQSIKQAGNQSQTLQVVLNRLWQLLHEQDDLAAPANAYMMLLAEILSLPTAAELLPPIDLSDVLPRLWPYLDHSTSSVRKATLKTLYTITKPLNTKSQVNGEKESPSLPWTPELLQDATRYVYQRIIFEHLHEIQDVAVQVWRNLVTYAPLGPLLMSACPLLCVWLCASMQPHRTPLDSNLILHPPPKERRVRPSCDIPLDAKQQKWLLGGSESQPSALRESNVSRARILAADALGLLSCYLVQPAPGIEYKDTDESPIDCYVRVITVYLRSGSALQRLQASLVLSYWARHTKERELYPPSLANGRVASASETTLSLLAPEPLATTLHTALNQRLYYDEVAFSCNRILQEARDLVAMLKHYKLPLDGDEFSNILRLEQVIHMTSVTQPMISSMKSKRVIPTLEERRKSLQNAANQCANEQATLNVTVQAALAGACANLCCLPEKVNPVMRPLMESIKKDQSEVLQRESAKDLAILMDQLVHRENGPNNKVLANLKAFLCCDPEFTPLASHTIECVNDSDSGSESNHSGSSGKGSFGDPYNGILSLCERNEGDSVKKRGRPSLLEGEITTHDESKNSKKIQRRGAILALTCLTKHFGASLPEKLPKLWEFIIEPFARVYTDEELEKQETEACDELITRLQLFECVCLEIEASVWQKVMSNCERVLCLCKHPRTAVRHLAARVIAVMAKREPSCAVMVAEKLLPGLDDMSSLRSRCGSSEAISALVSALQLTLVPYIALFVVPLLGRMSDPFEPVRLMSTRCFATLIQLMPLDGAVAEPEGLSEDLKQRRDRDRRFLERLFNPKAIEDYKVPVNINAHLRSYQQAGVNWLRFLNEYKLHGVLCDDMGLGKTLQCICILAGSHYELKQRNLNPLSLVVCPPTLTGHWVFEVNKFLPDNQLKPMQYAGPPCERERLRCQINQHNLIVASYDIVRKDIGFFSTINWNYCILDEGHVIKNEKTKAFKAIKKIVANHRLILSGTPIQNNVLELWSLFDFLQPGLLGSIRSFSRKYSRPILVSRENKATPTQMQAGALACEALHRQVLPFLLRRVKEDVLKELPPKITQDYFCELSPLQRQLYEDFSKVHMPQGLNSQHAHVFQALHYLQNVCNHPKLVLKPQHPEALKIAQQLAQERTSLDDIQHSAKLPALKQLLLDSGIGVTPTEGDTEQVLSQHRALIFCQLKKMLDIVEEDLLKKHLPNVSYLRLDGGIPSAARHAIVTRFNNDPTIDLLLLTTKVGGLGLNLTGADTVIFVEHDWNPMKDLQAMDRAHRIGQKRVVNVYRLITRDTLEEKIMGLQKFKLQTANTVISSENAAMETMGTEQLLDIVQMSNQSGTSGNNAVGNNSIMELPELWDEKQYDEEYDMTSFIEGLNGMKQ